MAKPKKKLTKLQLARRRDRRLLMLSLLLLIVPVIMMVLGVGTPGQAFR